MRPTRTMVIVLVVALLMGLLTSAAAAQPQEVPNRSGEEGTTDRPRPDGETVPGEIIVKYKDNARSATQASIRRLEGLQKKSELGLIHAELVKARGQSVGQAIRGLEARPGVEYAEPNFVYQPTGYTDEPHFAKLWGLNNTGQTIDGQQGLANVDVNGKEASARTQGDPNLVVAVIDDGVDFSHPDLSGRQWKNPGESGSGKETDGIDNDGNGKVDDVTGWDFYHGDKTVHDPGKDAHGTHVSGTIAASINAKGVVGVAPNVKIMALKFLSDDDGYGSSSGSGADAIKAIQYAKSKGAKISNNSWGGSSYSQALKDAIEASGSLFVAAAGNGGSDGVGDNNDASPTYPASYTSSNILSVAAVNNRGSLGRFSNYGKTSVDISAPGVDILSSVPGNPGKPDRPAVALSSVGTSGGKAVTAGFGTEEIGDATKRASFLGKAFQAISRDSQQVVLVDDDQSDDGLPDVGVSLSAAIESATGSAPQEIDVPYDADGPALSQLSGKTVVWASGEASDSYVDTTLTAADQSTLTNFLEGGGKLVITGMDALYGNESSSFVSNTLKLNVDGDVGGSTFAGASGTAFVGESYSFNGPPPYTAYHDEVAPAGAAAVIQGVYPGTPSTPAGWASWNGTSMATPHVSGAAALVAAKYPGLLGQPSAIKKIIMDTGKPLSATAGKTVTGDMVDAQAALFPRVRSTYPLAANPIKMDIPRTANVTVTFSEAMKGTTVNRKTFTLVKAGTASKISATVSYDSTKKATLKPSAILAANTRYKATIKGKSTGVKNASGDPMFTSKIWKFKTGS